MSKKKRKSYSREFKMEAVRLVTEKGYSMAEASRNLGIEYSALRCFYYIEIFYNRKRRHSSINYVTPQEYVNILLAA